MEEHGVLHVNLETRKSESNVIFSCSIHNIGSIDIGLHNTFLFIDQGVYNSNNHSYEFPFLQKKYLGIEGVANEDCIGCALCRKGIVEYPKDTPHISQFYLNYEVKPFTECYQLHHLSSESILYMAPNEMFTEELVVKLEPGVYRAILMCVPDPKTCDCMCCNRCFCMT